MAYDYAEVYADTVRESIVAAVVEDLGFRRDHEAMAPLVEDDTFEVEFRYNPDVHGERGRFTSFRTIIEIACKDGEDRRIVDLVKRIVGVVRSQGYVAVAVADFEYELTLPEPAVQVTYYAKVDERFPRDNPRGIVRRRVVDGVTHDEAFTRDGRWEPTEYLTLYHLGHNDVDHVEITKDEADAFIERVSRKLAGNGA